MLECTITGGGNPACFSGCLDAPNMLASGATGDDCLIAMVFRGAEDYDGGFDATMVVDYSPPWRRDYVAR